MRNTLRVGIAILTLSSLIPAQNQPKRGPSTADERQRFVKVVQELEKDPLNPGLRPDAKWALRWLEEVPDINVDLCAAPLGRLQGSEYRYSPQIVSLYVLAMGVYAIEHVEKAGDPAEQYLAGVESALRGYQAILKSRPEDQSEALEDLIRRRAEGKLADFVKGVSAQCKPAEPSPGPKNPA